MSRINSISPSSSPYEADSDASTMPSGLHKTKRGSKTTKKRKPNKMDPLPPAPSRVRVPKGPAQKYRDVAYVGGEKTAAIQSWNEGVPPKLTRPADEPDENDPVIRAYLEAKMELFRSAGRVEGGWGGGSEGSVSSRKS